MRRRNLALLAVLAAPLAACGDEPLAITNKSQPSADALLGSPAGTSTLISRLMQLAHNGQYGESNAIWPQASVMSYESAASVNNFGMDVRFAIPRTAISNERGNGQAAGNLRDYSYLTRTARQAASTIAAANGFATAGTPLSKGDRSFAFFSLGYSLGHLSLFYDTASVITPATASDSAAAFVGASEVNAAALQMLDSALALTVGATGTDGFPIPTGYLSTASAIPLDRWQRTIRSYRARFRAGLARNAAERAAVNWATVAADASNGLQDDLNVTLGAALGWTNAYIQQVAVSPGWHQMPYFVIGMADTSGGYQTWTASPLGGRAPFLILTPDKRFPQGATRAAQQSFQDAIALNPGVYFRNRPTGQDTPGTPYGTSFYENFRFATIRRDNGQGQHPIMTRAEVDMLAAEGYLRTGNIAAAVALINTYRTRNGLPAITAATSINDRVPGGNACIPRVPTAAGNTTECGTVFEAMKYEKRLETAFTGVGQWFIDGRGWNDLPEGTSLEWPVPFQETDARLEPTRRNLRRAVKGTYGI